MVRECAPTLSERGDEGFPSVVSPSFRPRFGFSGAAAHQPSVKSGEADAVCQRPITGVMRVTPLIGHRIPAPSQRCDKRAAHPSAVPCNNDSADDEMARDASRPRWARTIIRARMRSPRCNCCRCPAVYATDDPFEDAVVLFDGLLLSVLLIPLLRVGLGGIEDWPLRRRCRMSSAL